MMNYKGPFYLSGRRGNNVFAYDERQKRDEAEPRLYVPSVVSGSFDDLAVSEEPVFEEVDEHGVLQSCKGLKHFIKTEWQGVPTVVVDNHNHVFYFWYEALVQGQVERGAHLVHVDQHKDMRKPERAFVVQEWSDVPGEEALLEAAFRYTNEHLNVGNYIVPALDEGLLGSVDLVTSEAALDLEASVKPGCILNIDLDYFAAELDYIDFDKAKAFIWRHLEQASLVTIATSPFFIEWGRAERFLQNLIVLPSSAPGR